VTALALALAFLGSLAFASFVLWLKRQETPDVEERFAKLEAEVGGVAKGLAAVAPTVETLAIAYGLQGKPATPRAKPS
jgi:hypothetical protein